MRHTEINFEIRPTSIGAYISESLYPKPHTHKEYELIYVKKGSATVYASSSVYEISNGDLLLVTPFQIHYYDTKREGEFYIVMFSEESVNFLGAKLSDYIQQNSIVGVSNQAEITYVLEKIVNQSGEFAEVAISGYLNVLLSQLIPHITQESESMNQNATLRAIMKYCSENFREQLTLDTVALELHISKYYVSHLFSNYMRIGFNRYVNGLRVSEACILLRDTDMRIADISEKTGFGSIRAFNRAFKMYMRLSPIDYRNDYRRLQGN